MTLFILIITLIPILAVSVLLVTSILNRGKERITDIADAFALTPDEYEIAHPLNNPYSGDSGSIYITPGIYLPTHTKFGDWSSIERQHEYAWACSYCGSTNPGQDKDHVQVVACLKCGAPK